MNEFVPRPPLLPGGEPERTEHLDPNREVRESRYRWSLQSARWRARELAESIFDGNVAVRVQSGSVGAGASGAFPFRGLLHLDVPFRGLELHRVRERVFTACAAHDPVLSRVPFLFVFNPDPHRVGDGDRG